MIERLARFFQRRVAERRSPDEMIGRHDGIYLERWYLVPRNRLCNVYLHHFLRSDEDGALHDHPWDSVSVILQGGYWEVMPRNYGLEFEPGAMLTADGSQVMVWRPVGKITFRRGSSAHRVYLKDGDWRPWTLFITGPKYRSWGFLCKTGWRHWKDYVSAERGAPPLGCPDA